MNKQEAIELFKNNTYRLFGSENEGVPLEIAIGAVQLINEPAKVVVPKFVAEWIEKCKNMNRSLRDAMKNTELSAELNAWFLKTGQDMFTYPNQETFARAWLDGYEVKKERLYTVEIPNTNDDSLTVLEFISDSCIVLSQMESFPDNWKEMDIYQLTESEIKEDFEWAWNAGFAEPVEVEEVE
ncbi:DUF1642 domain-containing protein [Streptococcus minor]|uniref:DUF1642 domain-containing protein n=1 Tax=Streptococcus minor TaxID=229549 RepID=UPI00036FE6C7|nr:DUF1642 domain-containing protein [Streptococcus minor]